MILEVFDKNRNRIDMIRLFKSANYTIKFNGVGTFTIKVPSTEKTLPYLIRENYILLDKDVLGIIKYRSKVTSSSSDVTISGYMISRILSYRTFPKVQVFSGTTEEICYQMVENNFINAEDSKRNIPFVSVNRVKGSGEEKKVQRTGGTVVDGIISVLSVEQKGFYFKPLVTKFDESSGEGNNISNFEFGIIIPTNRTFQNVDGNTPITFSMDLNNLETLTYTEDGSDYKNYAFVAGAGEGSERVVTEVGDDTLSGIDRIEKYVDARDLSNVKYESDGTITTIPADEYLSMLKERGNERLAEDSVALDIDGKLIDSGSTVNKYGVDYFLGDYVTVIDRDLNYAVDAQITEFRKTISSGTEKVDLVFGYQKQTLRQILTNKGVI